MSTDQPSTGGEQLPRLRIAIAGGGICGGLLATQLRRSNLFDVCCFEKTPHTGGPPGVNLLLNHNGIAAIKDHDKDLYERLAAVGFEMKTWAALTMTGNCLYAENVVESGLADSAGLRARWDHFVAAIRAASEDGEDGIIYDATVESFRYLESGSVAVTILKEGGEQREEREVDLLIACDGRFSKIRAQVEGGKLPEPDVMDVANFKFLIPDTTNGLIDDYVRVYNIPDTAALAEKFPALAADAAFADECMLGLARIGIMRMRDPDGDKIGIYGNVRISKGGKLPELARTADAMRALFTPKEGVDAMDPLGKFVLDALVAKADAGDFHWERFQEAPAKMRDENGKVLIIGDAAHAFCPSLGQGASVAIEDACAAGAILREGAEAGMAVADMVALVEKVRLDRVREFARLSRHHAVHLAAHAGQQSALDAEVADWTAGAAGGTMEGDGWRKALAMLWKGWPRAAEVAAAVRAAAAAGGGIAT